MNIEEDLTSLKEIVVIRKQRCHGFIESDSCLVSTKRLETLLTAYEKEKGKNAKLRLQDIPFIEGELKAYKDRVNELKQQLEKEKEKNKELSSQIDEHVYNGCDYELCNKKWEDKIKVKIEPVLKQLDIKMKEEYNKYGNSREYQDIVDAYNFLQSLLEKE